MRPEVEDHLHGLLSLCCLDNSKAEGHSQGCDERACAHHRDDDDGIVERQDHIGLTDGQLDVRQLGRGCEQKDRPPGNRRNLVARYRWREANGSEDDRQSAGKKQTDVQPETEGLSEHAPTRGAQRRRNDVSRRSHAAAPAASAAPSQQRV